MNNDTIVHIESTCDSCYLASIEVVSDPCELQTRVWVEYFIAPATTPFTGKTIPHAAARNAGIASWARANRRAIHALRQEVAA